jgi:5-methylcytosine-specific restriction endonuclease McrA
MIKTKKDWRLKGRDYVRGLVRQRDNHQCQNCKRFWEEGKHFDVHHLNGLCGKKSRGYDRKADMDGLITLCHSCHINKHDKKKYGRSVLPKHPRAVRNMRARGATYDAIGKRFGVSSQAVYFFINGRA